MTRFFRSRKPGPTELTWEEKNPTDYRYCPAKRRQAMFSKQHYEVIASAISQVALNTHDFDVFGMQNDYMIAVDDIMEQFIDLFSNDNSSFDKELFCKACLSEAEEKHHKDMEVNNAVENS